MEYETYVYLNVEVYDIMPTLYSEVRYKSGTAAEYNALTEKLDNCLYFLTDTRQVFIGEVEYTKSVTVISDRPDSSTEGDEGRIYVCDEDGSSWTYVGGKWVAIYDPTAEVVHKIICGDGLDGGTITYEGTISHSVPNGAKVLTPDTTKTTPDFGDSFVIHEIQTDKFGHVTGLADRTVVIPGIDKLSTVFKYKGTVDTVADLPTSSPSDGDVYYVKENNSEYVYLAGSGWEELGPVVDLSGVIPKVKGIPNYVAMFDSDGALQSAGYTNTSGVDAGEYGNNNDNGVVAGSTFNVPDVKVDKYGRITYAKNDETKVVSTEFAVDAIAYIMEQHLGRM